MLEYLKIIKQLRYSAQQYYVNKAQSTYIHYKFTPDAPIRDRDRAKILIRASLRVRDHRRSKVFERYLLEAAKPKPAHV